MTLTAPTQTRPPQLRAKNLGQTKDGGRYAGHTRPDSAVRLDPAPYASGDTPLTPAQACAVAYAQAKNAGGRYLTREELEDVAQDAVLSVHKSVRSGAVPAMSPGLITKSVRHAISATLNTKNGVRHEEHRARQTLDTKIEAVVQDLGRMLHEPEITNLAMIVRETTKDQRHKPTVGYQIVKSETSYDVGDIRSEREALTDGTSADRDRRPGLTDDNTRIDEIADRRVTKKSQTVEMARDAFAVWADSGTLPELRARRTAVTARRELSGSAWVAEAWLNGEIPAEANELFSPWEVHTDDDRDAVARFLVERAGSADLLWLAAHNAVTTVKRAR